MKMSLGPKTVGFPTPVFVVGTYDKEGKPNAMALAWGGMCCSNPPCVAISLRKATYTYGNIVGRKAFTVNIPSEAFVKETDYFGMASGRKKDKFSAAGLTPQKSGVVDAPFIDEFPVVLECKLLHTIEIGLHTQFIGEIIDVKADETVVGQDGFPVLDTIQPIIFSPGDRVYYRVGESFAKAFSIGRKLLR